MTKTLAEDIWRGSSQCTHCSMFIYLEHVDEEVLDVVMAAAMEAHRDKVHPGTSLLDLTARRGFVERPDHTIDTDVDRKKLN